MNNFEMHKIFIFNYLGFFQNAETWTNLGILYLLHDNIQVKTIFSLFIKLSVLDVLKY